MERVALAVSAALLLSLLFARVLARRRLARRFAKGAAAEKDAVRLARSAGYRVLGTQVAGAAPIIVDGEAHVSDVRADLLLSRWGRRYLGEVKSGQRAPDPRDRDTRRQLLEYRHAFDVDGLLLFDMQARRIRRVEFPDRSRRRPRRLLWLAVGLGLGLTLPHAPDWAARAAQAVQSALD